MTYHRELQGKRLNAHCPYDEATLRQDMVYPDRAVCPICFTSMLKPADADKTSNDKIINEGTAE